jgi:hypothetical protein
MCLSVTNLYALCNFQVALDISSINRDFLLNSTAVSNSSDLLDCSTTREAFSVNSLSFEKTSCQVYRAWLQAVNQPTLDIQMFKPRGLLPCQQVNNTGTSADP